MMRNITIASLLCVLLFWVTGCTGTPPSGAAPPQNLLSLDEAVAGAAAAVGAKVQGGTEKS
ncbi:MAG: hypothetical protein LBQ55_11135 [Treponema sp.]|jgi:hypothetical protein|nr:hypothetical protein [Treponema sp.]